MTDRPTDQPDNQIGINIKHLRFPNIQNVSTILAWGARRGGGGAGADIGIDFRWGAFPFKG